VKGEIKIILNVNNIDVAVITDEKIVRGFIEKLSEAHFRQSLTPQVLAAYDAECAREDRDGK
jgi:hypothetical protein